jgi:hypothetical protein
VVYCTVEYSTAVKIKLELHAPTQLTLMSNAESKLEQVSLEKTKNMVPFISFLNMHS